MTGSNVPVEELLVALPIVNASRVPNDPQSERRVIRPRLGEQSVDSRGSHVGRQALERVQRARERGAERRGSVLGQLVMGDRLESIHESVLGCRCADIGDGSGTVREQNVQEVGIEELGDVRESDDARRGGGSGNRHFSPVGLQG